MHGLFTVVPVEEKEWAVLIATLAGTMLGAALQWMQAAWHARRERQRERENWSREDRRGWAEQRRRIYLDAIASARRQLNSYIYAMAPILDPQVRRDTGVVDLSRPWRRSPEVLVEWGRLLTEVEFYGTDEVREALEGLDLQLRMLELAPAEDREGILPNAESAYLESVAQMRRDLGLSEGRKARMRSSFGFLGVDLDQPPARGEEGQAPPSGETA